MTNLIKGIVFLPIESKQWLKYNIIKSNNMTGIEVSSLPKILMTT